MLARLSHMARKPNEAAPMTSQWFEETMLRNRRMHVEQCAIGIENIGAWRDIMARSPLRQSW